MSWSKATGPGLNPDWGTGNTGLAWLKNRYEPVTQKDCPAYLMELSAYPTFHPLVCYANAGTDLSLLFTGLQIKKNYTRTRYMGLPPKSCSYFALVFMTKSLMLWIDETFRKEGVSSENMPYFACRRNINSSLLQGRFWMLKHTHYVFCCCYLLSRGRFEFVSLWLWAGLSDSSNQNIMAEVLLHDFWS